MVQAETATFGAGCFWGVEETFLRTKGVLSTEVGFMGGTTEHPSSEDVYAGDTNHAEVVHLTFDPSVVSYAELLKIFFENHNPTSLNYQGPDYGTQYRSVVFCHSEEQREQAEKAKEELEKSGIWKKRIVTQILKAKPFYKAEDYHQQYLRKRGLDSCHI